MRTLLAAFAAVLIVALTPAAAAHADDEVVPDVTLSINSIILDPIKGGTQTVRIGGDSSVPIRIYVEDFAYDTYDGTMQIQRGGKTCRVRAVCTGTGDVTITYPPVNPDTAYIEGDGRVSPINVRAYADESDLPHEYIAQATGTVTVRYEFEASIRWLSNVWFSDTGPEVAVSWRVDGPRLAGSYARPTITIRLVGVASIFRGVSKGVGYGCGPEGADIVCRPDYKDVRDLGVLLTKCPSQDVLITISTAFYDPVPGNNQTYASASEICERAGGLGGSGGGSGGGGGGSGGGAAGGSGAGSPSAGPSDAPGSSPSSTSSSAAPSPRRSGATTSEVAVAPVSDGGSGGLWAGLAVVLAALLLGGGAAWWFWRRRTASPTPAPTTETSG